MQCPFCYQNSLDYVGYKDFQPVFVCQNCKLICSPVWDPDKYQNEYLTDDYLINSKPNEKSYLERFEHDCKIGAVRIAQYDRILGNAWRYNTIVDIGCGNGGFVKACLDKRLDIVGVDKYPNLAIGCLAKTRHNAFKYIYNIDIMLQSSYIEPQFHAKTIVTHDVIEHIQSPRVFLRKLFSSETCRTAEYLIVDTPDATLFDKRRLDYHHIKPLEHPFLYTEEHIKTLVEQTSYPLHFEHLETHCPIEGKIVLYFRRKR